MRNDDCRVMADDTDIEKALYDESSSEEEISSSFDVTNNVTIKPLTTESKKLITPSYKRAKLDIEDGTLNCGGSSCSTLNTDDDLLTCGKCKTKWQYSCTGLPPYQIALFLSSGYRKFVCERCANVPEELKFQCTKLFLNTNKETQKLRNELESKFQVIKSMETAHRTFNDLITDKDGLINSQKEVIAGMQIEFDDNRCKLLEAQGVITSMGNDINGLQEEINNLNEQNVGSKHSHHNIHLHQQIEVEREKNEELKRRLDDQIVITRKTELAFDTQNSLLNAKDEIIENQKIIIGQRKLVNSYQPSLDPDDVTSDDLNSH